MARVKKPTQEEVYSEEDLEFMSLVPEPHEPKLFEYTIKITKERNRRNALIS